MFVYEPAPRAFAAGVGRVDLVDGNPESLSDRRELPLYRRSSGSSKYPVHLPRHPAVTKIKHFDSDRPWYMDLDEPVNYPACLVEYVLPNALIEALEPAIGFELNNLALKLGSELGELDIDLSQLRLEAPSQLVSEISGEHRAESPVQTQVNTVGSCLCFLTPLYQRDFHFAIAR